MKKSILLLLVLTSVSTTFYAQRFITKTGHIFFYSEAPMETIEAHNKQVNAALDIKTGDMVFKVLMKSFIFEKALMQEHFNENYVESDKFPNATFKGKVTNLEEIDFSKAGKYPARVEGTLTIHGKSNPAKATGKFVVGDDMIHSSSKFNIEIADYDISIPGAVTGKISEEIEITVDVKLKEYKK
ncbi:MAG: YceI family protein [Bacteroidetes bacterium]|nr:MAG: YceI family protein [Bacteroidota bacterium]